jgi:hypothetical protein
MSGQRRVTDAASLAQVAGAARCNGGAGQPGDGAWGRPECVENAVHVGLCWGCYPRRRRWALNPQSDPYTVHPDPITVQLEARPLPASTRIASVANLVDGVARIIESA